MDNNDELPIKVTAEILPGKPDAAATARFANSDRAAQYALNVLLPSGSYTGGVWLTDAFGARHRLG